MLRQEAIAEHRVASTRPSNMPFGGLSLPLEAITALEARRVLAAEDLDATGLSPDEDLDGTACGRGRSGRGYGMGPRSLPGKHDWVGSGRAAKCCSPGSFARLGPWIAGSESARAGQAQPQEPPPARADLAAIAPGPVSRRPPSPSSRVARHRDQPLPRRLL